MTEIEHSLAERCRPIQALVLDVDGVLTDGGIIYGDRGNEIKVFHVRDGSGLRAWREAGKHAAIITGRTSRAVKRRAAELGIDRLLQGVNNKTAAFERLLSSAGWPAEQVASIGDDFPDLGVLRKSGLAAAVADACAEVRSEAHYVTQVPGGRGAVREVIELILRCQGKWNQALEAILAPRLPLGTGQD